MKALRLLTIDITSSCPNRCAHCHTQKNNSRLPVEKIRAIIEGGSHLGLTDIVISGGEPLVHPELLDIVHLCHEANIYVSILTSAARVDEKLIENLSKYTNITLFRISMESTDPAKLDRIRNSSGNYEKITRFIRLLRNTGKPFGISCTVNRWNEGDLEDMLLFALENRAAFIRFVPHISSDSSEAYPLYKLIRRVFNMIEHHTGVIRSGVAPLPETSDSIERLFNTRCPAGIFTGYLNSKMELGLCPFMNNRIDLNSNLDISAAWEKLQRLRVTEFSTDSPCLLGKDYFIHAHLIDFVHETSLLAQPLNSPIKAVFARILARQKEILSTGLAPCWRSSPLLLFPLQT